MQTDWHQICIHLRDRDRSFEAIEAASPLELTPAAFFEQCGCFEAPGRDGDIELLMPGFGATNIYNLFESQTQQRRVQLIDSGVR